MYLIVIPADGCHLLLCFHYIIEQDLWNSILSSAAQHYITVISANCSNIGTLIHSAGLNKQVSSSQVSQVTTIQKLNMDQELPVRSYRINAIYQFDLQPKPTIISINQKLSCGRIIEYLYFNLSCLDQLKSCVFWDG
ncbi:Hypothetical_protein [Hexamita inflata]|uniref:Hypothetical_protein n=1 Tax=Hexamita inflata TaxID=28002 RepID=A0AA86UUQ3_9EUKA|nr:Hypothetical protein HINF_LOCUS29158 [Hexamita inflata]CAI9972505.1 Hypothetical protein HINF_LOCUS60150 [Hexamita inflata]